MTLMRLPLTVAALALSGGVALAQSGDAKPVPLATANARALSSLLDDGFSVASATAGRPGEVSLIVRRDTKHYVCVLSEIRGENYGEAKAKPQALPCLPLN